MLYLWHRKLRSQDSRLLIKSLLKLWEVCQNTFQETTVLKIFYLLSGKLPQNIAGKTYAAIPRCPCNILYTAFRGFWLCKKADHFFQKKRYHEAALIDESLIASGYLSPQLLFRCAKAAFRHFKFLQAFYFCELLHICFPHWNPGKVLLFQGQCAQVCSRPVDAFILYSQAILNYGIPAIINEPGYEEALQKQLNDLPWRASLALIQAQNPHFSPLKKGQAFLLSGSYEEAESFLRSLSYWYRFRIRYHFLLARACIALRKKQEAQKILMGLLLRKKKYLPAYNEALRLACLTGDVALGVQITTLAQKNSVLLSPSIEWLFLCHMRKLKDAFIKHSQAHYFNILSPYLGKKFFQTLPRSKDKINTLLILSECFPGDEVKFSRLYPLIQQAACAEQIFFSCDPRMYPIFKRTFPHINFIATRRGQSIAMLTNSEDFTDLPDPECCRYVDNKGWEAIQKADAVISVMHALADVLQDYSQLTDLPRLLPDPEKKAYLTERLKVYRPQKLVGLAWRSLQNNMAHEWVNFRIEDLSPILQMENIQFVNCQYDGCTRQEQQWLEQNFPQKLLTLEDINQKEDTDAAAALYASLDAVITVPTYTCEVSGSIGTPTIIFAASHIPEAFMAPDSNYHVFLGNHTRFVCAFREKKDIILQVKKILYNMFS